jgi:hypothetical protein
MTDLVSVLCHLMEHDGEISVGRSLEMWCNSCYDTWVVTLPYAEPRSLP